MAPRKQPFWLQFFTWWNGTTLGTGLYTARKGVAVGEDDQGNRYYQDRAGKRRWVIYNGIAEASRIPPGWHGWMHWRTDELPTSYRPHEWEKPHQPNMTGTSGAYHPPGSILRPEPVTPGDAGYEPWTPR
jgi:NADH:ubiquinone oxidoreductase subunit